MGDAERERIVDVATRLFAELGFDGTPWRLIADTTGVETGTLTGLFGDKASLYREVMLGVHQAERDALVEAAASFTPTRQGVIDLVDAYLDFHVEHPQVVALWLQRWIGDAADIPDLEERVRSLSVMMASAVQEVTAPDIDAEYMIWTIVWCVHGFLSGGIQHPGPHRYHARGEPLSPQALRRFRAHLHALIVHITAPQDDGAG
ncbi:TetR/AcrR family transcriptional regulator [Actinocorallia populi]|uniref:TetR/AcrR family transcriptional regulator n=1 Tax=Actinocorallia populi TaxID=2079200 RepID=UPI000D095508|nr:TetR/AcrR family transcriptional regulator [Actinocorallia populi]